MTPLKRNILIVVVIAIVALLWAAYDLGVKPAKKSIRVGVLKIVEIEPRVKPMYQEAMKDGVLTTLEAKRIIDRADELDGR
jgi:hypothetical protein